MKMPYKQQYKIGRNIHNRILQLARINSKKLTRQDIRRIYIEPLCKLYAMSDYRIYPEFIEKIAIYGAVKRNCRKKPCTICGVQSGSKHNLNCKYAHTLPDDSKRKNYKSII